MKRRREEKAVYHWGYNLSAAALGVERVLEAHLKMRRGVVIRHTHAEHQVIWVLSGTLGMDIESRRLRCEPGEALVLKAGVEHGVYWPTDVQEADATILDLRLSVDARRPSDMTRFVADLPVDDGLSGDVRRWWMLARNLRETARWSQTPARTARIGSVLWALLADLTGEPAPVPAGGRVGRAEALMTERLADATLDVARIADHVGLSRSQLTRLFMDHHRVGPAEHLRRLRVEHARVLLATSTLGVKEIARYSGFVHTSKLTRVFRDVTGETPTQFREGAGRG